MRFDGWWLESAGRLSAKTTDIYDTRLWHDNLRAREGAIIQPIVLRRSLILNHRMVEGQCAL